MNYILLVALSIFIRIPFLFKAYWNRDEAFVLVEAMSINNGGKLYKDVVDRKPPLLPYLYSLVDKVSHNHVMLLIHILGIIELAIILIALYLIINKINSKYKNGLFCATLFIIGLLSLRIEDFLPFNFELLTILWISLAYLFYINNRYILLGIFVGLALLTEQQAFLMLFPILIDMILYKKKVFLLQSLLTTLLVILIALQIIPLDINHIYFWIFKSSSRYINPSYINIQTLIIFLVIIVKLIVVNIFFIKNYFNIKNKLDYIKHKQLFYNLFFIALLSMVISTRFLTHYLLYVLFVSSIILSFVKTYNIKNIIYSISVLLILFIPTNFVLLKNTNEGHLYKLTYEIKKHVRKKDKIVVWSKYPEIYYMTNTLPAIPFVTPSLLINYINRPTIKDIPSKYSVVNGWKMLEDYLRINSPNIIVDDLYNDNRGKITNYDTFNKALHNQYYLYKIIDGSAIYLKR